MDLKKKNILVVDENPYILASLPDVLNSYFNKVETLENTDRLVSVLSEDKFDLLLLDITLAGIPDKESKNAELFNKILQVSPDILIILLTRVENVDQAAIMLEAGAVDFVLKPWNPLKLIKNIHQVFHIRHLEKEVARLKKQPGKTPKNESLNLIEKEKDCISKALFAYQGNMTHAARQLGITRATLYAKIKKYGLTALDQ